MKRSLALLAIAVATSLALPAQMALAEGGVIQGAVINKTTDQPVSGQLVELHVTLADGTTAPNLQATTGQDGRFSFEGVALKAGTMFALCTTYLDAMSHDPFEAPTDGPQVSRDLAVYETTDSDEAIGMSSSHVIFHPRPEEGWVEVQEFVMIENTGNRTYVGPKEGGAGNPGETLHFTLPEGASAPTLASGISEDEARVHEGGFCSTAPVLPGEQSIVYSYGFSYPSRGALNFRRPLDFHPSEVLVLTYNNQGVVTGPGITSQGPVAAGDDTYGAYRVSLAPSQQFLELSLSGLAQSTSGSGLDAKVKAGAGGITALGLAGGVYLAMVIRRRRALATVKAPAARKETKDELDEMDDYES